MKESIEVVGGYEVFRITKPKALDPITVFLRDLNGSGQIIIECYGSAWSFWVGGSSGRTLTQFIAECGSEYLVDKFCNRVESRPSLKEKIYVKRIIEAIQDAIKSERKT